MIAGIFDGIVGAVLGAAATGIGFVWKRRYDHRARRRLLIRELQDNWTELDRAAPWGAIDVDSLRDEDYRANRDSASNLLSDEAWQKTEDAYQAIAELKVYESRVDFDLTIVKVKIDLALDRCAIAIRALGGEVPTHFDLAALEDSTDKILLEARHAGRVLNEVLEAGRRAVEQQESNLSPDQRAFGDWVETQLNNGVGIVDIAQHVHDSLPGLDDKEREKIDNAIVALARAVRAKKRQAEFAQKRQEELSE